MKKTWIIPRVLGLGLLMETLDSTILNTALPQMALTLKADVLSLKLAIISYFITLAAFLSISGYLTDRFGTKRVFFIAVGVFVLSSFGCGMAQTLSQLIVGRLAQGMSAAMITPVGRLILLKTFERKDYIKAFSSLVMIGQIGIALGPTLGGILTTFLGWRWIFFVNIPVGCFLLWLIAHYIPDYSQSIRYSLDKIGFFLFAGSLAAMTFGLAWMTEQAFQNDIYSLGLVLLGLILFLFYLLHLRICPKPLLRFSLLKVRTFRIAIMGNMICRIPLNAPFFLLTLLMQMELNFSAFKAGLFLIPYGLGMAMTKTGFRYLIHRFGFRRCLLVNPILLALVLFSFSLIHKGSPSWLLMALIGMLGILTSCQFSSMNTLVFSDVEAAHISEGSMITGVCQQLAISIAVCVAAGLLVFAGRYYHIPALSLTSFHVAFIVLSGIMLLSLFIFQRLNHNDGAAVLSKN